MAVVLGNGALGIVHEVLGDQETAQSCQRGWRAIAVGNVPIAPERSRFSGERRMPRKKAEVTASPSPPPNERLLTTAELCRLYGITPRTAQRWRRSGHGPEWLKLTDGECAPVRYLESAVLAWLQSRRVTRSRAGHPPMEKPALLLDEGASAPRHG